MALIKCPGCGNMISDKAIKCPKCGMPVTKYEVKPQHNHIANEAPVFSEREGSSNMWLYGIIALLLVAIAGCGYWWYRQNHSVEHLLASSETDSHQNEGTGEGAMNDSGEISAQFNSSVDGMTTDYPKTLHIRYMKNGMSDTPCTCALKPLIFEFSDSAEAFV